MRSAATARRQVPAIARLVDNIGGWDRSKKQRKLGTHNLDIGAGPYGEFTDWLFNRSCITNWEYDPGHVTALGNAKEQEVAIRAFRDDGNSFDSITISNVLNVVTGPEMVGVLDFAAGLASSDTDIYITVYEGDRLGRARKTRDGYQQNKPIQWYEQRVRWLLKSPRCYQAVVERRGSLIVANTQWNGADWTD